jgi:hypothetical protein
MNTPIPKNLHPRREKLNKDLVLTIVGYNEFLRQQSLSYESIRDIINLQPVSSSPIITHEHNFKPPTFGKDPIENRFKGLNYDQLVLHAKTIESLHVFDIQFLVGMSWVQFVNLFPRLRVCVFSKQNGESDDYNVFLNMKRFRWLQDKQLPITTELFYGRDLNDEMEDDDNDVKFEDALFVGFNDNGPFFIDEHNTRSENIHIDQIIEFALIVNDSAFYYKLYMLSIDEDWMGHKEQIIKFLVNYGDAETVSLISANGDFLEDILKRAEDDPTFDPEINVTNITNIETDRFMNVDEALDKRTDEEVRQLMTRIKKTNIKIVYGADGFDDNDIEEYVKVGLCAPQNVGHANQRIVLDTLLYFSEEREKHNIEHLLYCMLEVAEQTTIQRCLCDIKSKKNGLMKLKTLLEYVRENPWYQLPNHNQPQFSTFFLLKEWSNQLL